MFRTIFGHRPLEFAISEKIKAGFLCFLILVASAPSLNAQSKVSDPYETNCVVTIGPVGCGYGGLLPCWINYVLTVNDDTPGAWIEYTIQCGQVNMFSGQTYSGQQINWTASYGDRCYSYGESGSTMYAIKSGYINSNTVYLSF